MKENEQEFNQEALHELFAMQPDNRLTPAQMVRRSLFPRWEIITPAPYDPVQVEDRMLQEVLVTNEQDLAEERSDRHPDH